jgi:hypothetical protein
MTTKIEPVTTEEAADMSRLYWDHAPPKTSIDEDFAWAVNVVLARRKNVSVAGFTGKEEA